MSTLISSCNWYLLSTKNLPTIENYINELCFAEKQIYFSNLFIKIIKLLLSLKNNIN